MAVSGKCNQNHQDGFCVHSSKLDKELREEKAKHSCDEVLRSSYPDQAQAQEGQRWTCICNTVWVHVCRRLKYGRSLTGEVLGVRVLPDGRREYLCMNKALDPQRYYVMDSL